MGGQDPITEHFDRLGPWVTRFTIDGREYGGSVSLDDDRRVRQFFEAFPDARTVLELGSLEGAHTFQLAARAGAHVTAVEGREENLERARFLQRLLAVDNVAFHLADLETARLASFGRFDAVFCCGLLYHLPEPWRLLDDLASASDNVFIWTHVASDEAGDVEIGDLRGCWYEEGGRADMLSGLSPRSFWLTLDSLLDRLTRGGYAVEVLDEQAHQHGPAVTLAARRPRSAGSFAPRRLTAWPRRSGRRRRRGA